MMNTHSSPFGFLPDDLPATGSFNMFELLNTPNFQTPKPVPNSREVVDPLDFLLDELPATGSTNLFEVKTPKPVSSYWEAVDPLDFLDDKFPVISTTRFTDAPETKLHSSVDYNSSGNLGGRQKLKLFVKTLLVDAHQFSKDGHVWLRVVDDYLSSRK